jgi:hypothetical protein
LSGVADLPPKASAPDVPTFSPPDGWLAEDVKRAGNRIAQWDAEKQPRNDGIGGQTRPIATATLARHMAAWLQHLSHWTELPDDAVVLAVASPDPTEAVRITAGMIRDAAGR